MAIIFHGYNFQTVGTLLNFLGNEEIDYFAIFVSLQGILYSVH